MCKFSESPSEMKEAMILKPVLMEIDRLCIGTEPDRERAMALLEREEANVSGKVF